MYSLEELKSFLKKRLSKKRFIHSLNVADEAYKLAGMYGEDPDKAYLAGLLHDVCKEKREKTGIRKRSCSCCTTSMGFAKRI